MGEKTIKKRKPLTWLNCEIKTPPFSDDARIEAGEYLRRIQEGEMLSMPKSRPMPSIGPHCHELRINDDTKTWRIIYRIDDDFIPIVDIFNKTTGQTPLENINRCKSRLKDYDNLLEK